MRRTMVNVKVSGFIALMLLVCSCVDNQRDLFKEPEKLPKDQYFDFNMNQNLNVNIDYSFKNVEEYPVLFEIYSQNPIETNEADGSWKKIETEPLYRASTDKKGKFSGEITIISDISEVWLWSDYLGTVSPVKLQIGDDHRLSFNQDEYIQARLAQLSAAKTKGITANSHNYLDDWTLIPGADWDNNGRPNNLSPEINTPPTNVLYNIKEVFKKANGKNITDNYPHFFDGRMTSDVPIIKPTKVSLVFVNSTASWHNTIGYYTYPTGETPKIENIKKILAFPNASPIHKSNGIGALLCGEEVQLKYWNDATGEFEEEFPEGVTIGWCLQGMGFQTKPETQLADIVNGMGIRYSTTNLNKDGKQRTVSLRDAKSNQIVAIGFEDNIDFDYCDALFYIHTSETDAIEPGLPELPENPGPSEEDNYVSYSGTLTFEDLWPDEGDYDMNDVMIRYTSKIYRNVITNRVYKIVDKFTPFHRGGYLSNGFGYQLHNISNSDISSVTIDGPDKSKYMTGETESGQSHPTILLFDNIAKNSVKEYTVTINIKQVAENSVVPPYNPFIFIESDKTRGKEVHLAKYPPTDKADLTLFGTGKDASRPEEDLYYVSIDLMPFALNMPISDFPIPEEGIRIDESYPKFATWVKSNGTEAKDWYKHPRKE